MSRPRTIDEAVDRLKWASLQLPTQQELRIHEGNKRPIEQTARWLFESPAFEGDLNKGLEFRGPKGTGKSHLMRCISQLLTPQGFMVKKCADIVTEFSDTSNVKINGETQPVGGYGVIDKYAAMPRICFDDLCDEPMAKWYGEEVNVMQLILAKRGDLMATRPLLTMFTTNHGPEKQEERYGARVRDRKSLMVTPFVVAPDPNPSAMGFRETANVISWRNTRPEAKAEPITLDPALAELMEQLANEKNEARKRDIEDQQQKKTNYLELCLPKFRKMTMRELMHAAQLEPYAEAKEMARAEFDRRSPVSLADIEKQAREELDKRDAERMKKVANG